MVTERTVEHATRYARIAALKAFADERLPQDTILRTVLLSEPKEMAAEAFLAKGSTLSGSPSQGGS